MAILAATVSCAPYLKENDGQSKTTLRSVPTYTFTIVNTYTHDRDAFTQGLAFVNGTLYEGTGLYGKSSLRRVDLKTCNVLQAYKLRMNILVRVLLFSGTPLSS